MPDANGNYQSGEFLPQDVSLWQVDRDLIVPLPPVDYSDFPDNPVAVGRDYRIAIIHPSGSRLVLETFGIDHNFTIEIVRERFAELNPDGYPAVLWGTTHTRTIISSGSASGTVATIERGEYLPYIPLGEFGHESVALPVNQLEWAPEFRELLASLAHVLDTEHHGKHGANARQRRIETRDATLSDDDMLRNGNVSQVREMVGHVWHEMHEWLALDPTDDATGWNTTALENIRLLVGKLRGAAGKRPSPRRLFTDHNARQWKALYDANARFLPEPAGRPIGVFLPDGARRHSAWEAGYDLQNNAAAAHYYTDSEGNGWPASTFVPLPKPNTVPTGTDANAERRQALQQYWIDQVWYLRRLDEVWIDPESADAVSLLQGYRRFAEMNYLATMVDENWTDEAKALIMTTNRLDAEDYVDLTTNPIRDRWGAADSETSYRRGFFIYNTGANTLTRDARDVDADDGTTTPESEDVSQGDDRLTDIVVIPPGQIDRRLTAAQDAHDDPWTREAAVVFELESVFGAYGD